MNTVGYALLLLFLGLPATSQQTAETVNQKQRAAGTHPAEPPPVLQQLNSALEELSARISPAVVQIVVT